MIQPRSQKNAEVTGAILDLCSELLISNDRDYRVANVFIDMHIKNLFEVIDKHTPEEQKDPHPGLVDLKTNAGYSAIYYAVKMGNFRAFKKLIEKGADLNDIYDGLTLRDIVQQELAKDAKNSKYQKIDDVLSGKEKTNSKQFNIGYNENLLKEFTEKITIKEEASQAWIKRLLQKRAIKNQKGSSYQPARSKLRLKK